MFVQRSAGSLRVRVQRVDDTKTELKEHPRLLEIIFRELIIRYIFHIRKYDHIQRHRSVN